MEIQKELVDRSQYYVNIYKLHAIWKKYRVERGESLFVNEGKSEAVELEYAVLAHLEKFEVLNENKAHLDKISKLYK